MKIYDGHKLIAEGRADASFWHRLPKRLEKVTIGFRYIGAGKDVQPPEAKNFRIEISLSEFKTMMTSVINSMR